MNIEEAIALLETKGYTVINYENYRFFVTGEGLGELYPDLSLDKDDPKSYLHNTVGFNFDQFSAFVSDMPVAEPSREGISGLFPGQVSSSGVDYDAVGAGNGGLQGPPQTYPPNQPWPPQLREPIIDPETGAVTGYEYVPGTVDWDAYFAILGEERLRLQGIKEEERFRGTREEKGWMIDEWEDASGNLTRTQARQIQDPKQSLDNLIALALGEVDNWSATEGIDYDNIQRARALFDFKNQPTDAERLRMAMDIAQSPSDYMTLVAMYTGAISSEGVGGKVAPLMPYLQQMAQKFFLDIPGINEITPKEDGRDMGVEFPWNQPPGPIDGGTEVSPGQIVSPIGGGTEVPPAGFMVTPSGRLYNPTTPMWEPLEEFHQRTGEDPTVWEPLKEFEQFPDVVSPAGDVVSPAAFRAKEEKTYGGSRTGFDLPWDQSPEADSDARGEFRAQEKEQYGIPSFQYGGIVPGKMGEPQLIRAEGGEIVIPNAVRSPYTKSLFGGTFTPRRETFGRFLTSPAKVQIPSMPTVQAAQFRFRSPQTIRRMTPMQRSLFQASTQPMFGVPYEDWRMQERLATGAGGAGRPRAQFRRPSFVRG
jgi:hypothetical protein